MYPVYQLPAWIADEQLLRDEAVLFGLSEARPDEKILSIRLAFAALTASLDKQIEQYQEQLMDLDRQLATNQPLPTPQAFSVQPSVLRGPMVRSCAGVLVSLLLCAGTYWGAALLTTKSLALLLALLVGLSGCVGALLMGLALYRTQREQANQRQTQANTTLMQQRQEQADGQRQKQAIREQLSQAEALLNQHQAHRDLLIQVFESEFDLARSLRHQVRDRLMNY